ncbi:MAG: TRAP transporter substrate-binding protein DctP [bacterium]|nr:TRAP transporter substrate-binding protein DctP [bacterium]
MFSFRSHLRRWETTGFLFFLFLVPGLFFSPAGKARAEEPRKAEAKYLLKLGTIAPENSSWGDTAKQASREVLAKTNGQVKFVWYFGAVLGDEPDMIMKIRLGQLQGAVFTLMGAGKIAPDMRIFALPMLFNNYEEADYVLNRMTVTIDKLFSEKGFVNLGLADIGFARTFSKAPLRNETDFSRVKAWTWSLSGEPLEDEYYKMMGANNFTPLPLTDVLISLQTGLVNLVYGTCYTTIGLQWHTQLKYMSKFKGSFSPGAILIDQKVFDTLPPNYQQIIREAFQKAVSSLRQVIRNDEEKACAGLRKYGLVEYDADPDFLKKIKSDSGKLFDKFADIYYPRWLLAGVLNVLQQYRVVTGANKK